MKFRPLVLMVCLTLAGLLAAPVLRAQDDAEMKGPEVFKIDPVHSSVMFRVMHLGVAPFWGTFEEIDGEFHIDRETPENSKIMVTVPVKSIDTRNDGRDKHVLSPDYLNAEEFPTAKFESTAVKFDGESKWMITGDFTLHGQTKPVEVTLTVTGQGQDPWGNFRLGGEAEFTFNRKEWGVAGGGVGDEVKMIIGIEGIRQ